MAAVSLLAGRNAANCTSNGPNGIFSMGKTAQTADPDLDARSSLQQIRIILPLCRRGLCKRRPVLGAARADRRFPETSDRAPWIRMSSGMG